MTDVVELTLAATIDAVPGLTGTVGDASNVEDVDRVFADVSARLGGLDLLVNNAGIAGPTGRVDELSAAEVDKTIDVNLKSQFYFLERFVPLLTASKRNPSIIGMSSVAGRLGYGFRTPYAATKWAIVGLDQVAGDRARAAGHTRERDPSRRVAGPEDGPRHRRSRGGHGRQLR